jgi:hypothetical protein
MSDMIQPNLSKEASDFLLELAQGMYDREVAMIRRALISIAPIWPPADGILHALDVLIWINRKTAPIGGVLPDGRGGYVPASNSRIGPDGNFL